MATRRAHRLVAGVVLGFLAGCGKVLSGEGVPPADGGALADVGASSGSGTGSRPGGCGDGVCDSVETCTSCPEDCGACGGGSASGSGSGDSDPPGSGSGSSPGTGTGSGPMFDGGSNPSCAIAPGTYTVTNTATVDGGIGCPPPNGTTVYPPLPVDASTDAQCTETMDTSTCVTTFVCFLTTNGFMTTANGTQTVSATGNVTGTESYSVAAPDGGVIAACAYAYTWTM
jgi:hypothetical protein